LWVDFSTDSRELIVYKFLRVVFGLTSSPFLLNWTVRQHLKRFENKYPCIINKLKEDLYVDDTTTGCNSVEEGIEDCEKTIGDDTTFAQCQITGMGTKAKQKVLGLEWDKKADEFVFDFEEFLSKSKSVELTKRNILSLSASIYDPIGMISPISAQIKTIFQDLCVDKSDWDDIVSGETKDKWVTLLEKLEILEVVRINRFAFVDWREILSIELHGFCDSSVKLYCAVVYVKIVTKNGVKVFFWSSKTKVAPLKSLTIPRLELLGCVLLTKLIEDINRALLGRVKIDRVVCWTDSKVALYWIKGKEKTWKPWVENRVVKIRKIVPKDMWFHVAGIENPADAPTRVVDDFSELFSGVWFKGPSFLFDLIDFDGNCDDSVVLDAQQEIKTNIALNTLTLTEHDKTSGLNKLFDFTRYSSLNKLVNIVAYVLRFKNNLLAKIRNIKNIFNDTLTFNEVNSSLSNIIIAEQKQLMTQQNFNKLKTSLNLFIDQEGIYRLKSRFRESKLSYEKKHPILIRQGSYFTKLVVQEAHNKVLHMGIEATLAKIRESYWIINGRRIVKNILKKCVVCKHFQGRTMSSPSSPDLPEYRVNHLTRAFEATGLDFAGPLFIKDNTMNSKVYILLFTCASSRAIHLELTPDMKSPAFIRAFKRFVARRGKPNIVVMDNFKTFKSIEVKSWRPLGGADFTNVLYVPLKRHLGKFSGSHFYVSKNCKPYSVKSKL